MIDEQRNKIIQFMGVTNDEHHLSLVIIGTMLIRDNRITNRFCSEVSIN